MPRRAVKNELDPGRRRGYEEFGGKVGVTAQYPQVVRMVGVQSKEWGAPHPRRGQEHMPQFLCI